MRSPNCGYYPSPFPGLILKWRETLDRYGTHQETISRRPEQMHTSSDTRLEWLARGEGPLFKSDSNKRWMAKMQPLFESTLSHYRSQVLVQI